MSSKFFSSRSLNDNIKKDQNTKNVTGNRQNVKRSTAVKKSGRGK